MCPKQQKTSDHFAQVITNKNTHSKAQLSTVWSKTSWHKVVTSPTIMEQVAFPSMEPSSPMRTSILSTTNVVSYQWRMLGLTLMVLSSSSLLALLIGWMELMLCLVSWLKETKCFKRLKLVVAEVVKLLRSLLSKIVVNSDQKAKHDKNYLKTKEINLAYLINR